MRGHLTLFSGLITFATFVAPSAQADPGAVDLEIMMNGKEVVCTYFDTNGVTPASLNTMGQYYLKKGFTSAEAAEIVSTSVKYWCKQYLPALNIAATVNSGG
jgi:hypothetical protein